MFEAFRYIARTSGKSAQERKQRLIVQLLQAARQDEAAYIIRTLQVGPGAAHIAKAEVPLRGYSWVASIDTYCS